MTETVSAKQYQELWGKPKPSKFRNRKTRIAGIEHASKKQGMRWLLLRQWEREGKIRNLRREVPYKLQVNGILIATYIADHVFEQPMREPGTAAIFTTTWVEYSEDGSEIVHVDEAWEFVVEDVKSPITRKLPDYRIKKKLMKAIHGIEIREV